MFCIVGFKINFTNEFCHVSSYLNSTCDISYEYKEIVLLVGDNTITTRHNSAEKDTVRHHDPDLTQTILLLS